tara:strand:+ start:52 stop:528 length:477 start_codon:yes stop_codon:yes gene_type:complete
MPIRSENFPRPSHAEMKERLANPDDQHFLEANDLDGEYDHNLCGARVWNHGFGGQCRRPVEKTNEELEKRLVGWDGSKGGLCKCHFSLFNKNGKITHGLFTEYPSIEDHPWVWEYSESAWETLRKEKKTDPTLPKTYDGLLKPGQTNLDEFGNWVGPH